MAKPTAKDKLIDKLVNTPRKFTRSDFDRLFQQLKVNSSELKQILLRIFDINDTGIVNNSESNKGFLGRLNRRSQKQRADRFWRKIRSGKFSKIILAEGDSWFEYPVFIDDVLDHLMDREDYAVYSLAYGGDWISNILYEHHYIEMLSQLMPNVFMISGGGNDIVGNNRLAQLIHKRSDVVEQSRPLVTKEERLKFADLCFNDEFHVVIRLFELQYRLLFESLCIKTKKFQNMKILTHGYDYAVPTSKLGFGIVRPITNALMGHGEWLKQPLMLRGYSHPVEQKSIVFGMIEHFNEALIKAGRDYENVFHIDCRTVIGDDGWYNELHPFSKGFWAVAEKFRECIEDTPNRRKIY